MAEPPSYDDTIAWEQGEKSITGEGDSKGFQHFSIRDEVGTSRSQHVAALVSKLLPQIRERAKCGLSRTTLLLLPSDQAESSKKGNLVGFPEDDRPIMIQLEGRYDTTQFWTQDEALKVLREQILLALVGNMSIQAEEAMPLPERPAMPPAKSSWWGRKQSKAPEPPTTVSKQTKPPVTVQVQLDQVNFRSETEYGLYETIRGRALLVVVDIR